MVKLTASYVILMVLILKQSVVSELAVSEVKLVVELVVSEVKLVVELAVSEVKLVVELVVSEVTLVVELVVSEVKLVVELEVIVELEDLDVLGEPVVAEVIKLIIELLDSAVEIKVLHSDILKLNGVLELIAIVYNKINKYNILYIVNL